MCVCQTGIYKLSLTKLSHSNSAISYPAQPHPFYPTPVSTRPRQLSKMPVSPNLDASALSYGMLIFYQCLPSHAPCNTKMDSRTRLSQIKAWKYPHFAKYHLSYLFDRASCRLLVTAFLSFTITSSTDNTSGI